MHYVLHNLLHGHISPSLFAYMCLFSAVEVQAQLSAHKALRSVEQQFIAIILCRCIETNISLVLDACLQKVKYSNCGVETDAFAKTIWDQDKTRFCSPS